MYYYLEHLIGRRKVVNEISASSNVYGGAINSSRLTVKFRDYDFEIYCTFC